MDYGGVDKRRSKKDLKRKRLARGYKRGGQFRTHEVNKEDESEKRDKMGKLAKKSKKGRK